MKKIINCETAPQAIGPYSQAIKSGGMLYISGQIPMDPETGEVIDGGIKEQTKRSLDNLKEILEEAGYTLEDIVKTTVYLTNIDDFVEMNTVYAKYFHGTYPARVCVEVSRLPKDALIEIDLIAIPCSKVNY